MGRPEYYGNPAGLTGDVDVVRALYAAFAERNAERAVDLLAPDCELEFAGTARAVGREKPYRGHEGMREYVADVERVWDELVLHADDIRVVPGSVIVLGWVHGKRADGEIHRAAVWTFRLRDGLAVSVRVNDMGPLAG